VVADCSLEYNALIKVLQPYEILERQLSFFRGFSFDAERCTHCGMCLGVCLQDALAAEDEQMCFYEYRCTHCGSCVKWCPVMSLSHEEHSDLSLYSAMTRFGPLLYTHSFVEPSLQPEMIRAIRHNARQMAKDRGLDLLLINGSRGLRNTTLAATEGADALLAVVSPSPHAPDDLLRIIHFSRKAGHDPLVIINMTDIDMQQTERMEEICHEQKAKLVGQLNYSPDFREALLRNKSINEYMLHSPIADAVAGIWPGILEHAGLVI
jgi:MinD superfamily P-loop ATPase